MGLADASEFAAELKDAKAVVTLPAGRSWPAFLTVDPNVSYSRGGGREWVEEVAMCEWFDEWLDARAAAEVPRAATAGRAIAEIPTWPSWSGPFWTQSFRDHHAPLIAAVAAGEEAPVRANMPVNCSWLTAP